MNESSGTTTLNLLLGLFAVLVPLGIWLIDRRGRKWRELTIEVHQRWQLETYLDDNVVKDIKEAVEIKEGTDSLLDTSLVRFSITNTGRAAIQADVFDKPAHFTFGPRAKIIKARITNSLPTGMQKTVKLGQGTKELEIQPFLLNPKERIDVEVFGTNFDTFEPNLRLIGLSEIQPGDKSRIQSSVLYSRNRGCLSGFIVLFILFVSLAILVLLLATIFARFNSEQAVYTSLVTTSIVQSGGIDSVLDLIDSVVDSIAGSIIYPFFNSPEYRRGFVTALVFAFLSTRLASIILYSLDATRTLIQQLNERIIFKYSDR